MTARVVAGAALVVAAAAAAAVLLGGSGYTLRADFADGSQLVPGGAVRIAGRSVGHITDVGLTDDGHAWVRLAIDGGVGRMHAGTRAQIRALSQAGVANRYVELTPGPASARALDDGATLPLTQTQSLVNLDAILDSFGPSERAGLRGFIGHSADVFAGSGARSFNHMLGELDPAMRELSGLTTELGADRAALRRVVASGAAASGAIASRRTDLVGALRDTATAMGAIADRRDALSDVLARAPGVLDLARGTLADAGTAVTALRPALREVLPAAGPLRGFLARLDTLLPATTPVIRQLRGQLPALRSTLAGLPSLRAIADPAIRSAGRALTVARPIVRAARFYGSDLLLGVFQGLAGVATANYDRWGHYARLEFTQPYQSALASPLSDLLTKHPLAPSLFNLRSRLLRRCPGGNTAPAPDGSNPWVPDKRICTPSQDVSPDVNTP